jgi:hypothetical protein
MHLKRAGAKALKQQECQDGIFHKFCGYLVRERGETMGRDPGERLFDSVMQLAEIVLSSGPKN